MTYEANIFAIRHVPTNAFMPAKMTKSGRGGWSHWQPEIYQEVGDKNPRLFFTKKGAQNALTAWLMGVHRRESGTYYDHEGVPDGYDDHIIDEPPAPAPRNRVDMEIVLMKLEEIK